jgi:hypothetical protein
MTEHREYWPALNDHFLPLPVGWVEYVEKPFSDQQRIVRCPIEAAPSWVRSKHALSDTKEPR